MQPSPSTLFSQTPSKYVSPYACYSKTHTHIKQKSELKFHIFYLKVLNDSGARDRLKIRPCPHPSAPPLGDRLHCHIHVNLFTPHISLSIRTRVIGLLVQMWRNSMTRYSGKPALV